MRCRLTITCDPSLLIEEKWRTGALEEIAPNLLRHIALERHKKQTQQRLPTSHMTSVALQTKSKKKNKVSDRIPKQVIISSGRHQTAAAVRHCLNAVRAAPRGG